jgi:hypothetical protein
MEKKLKDTAAEVALTCLEERYLKNEIMLDHHCFVRVISGEVKIISADRSVVYGPGDTILFPRRELSTVIQYPKGGGAIQMCSDHPEKSPVERLFRPQSCNYKHITPVGSP